ncbi:MAG: HD domain-containing protein, partial [Chloroflexi bacterium]
MNETTFIAATAGLLHDIGKFMLRAGESGTRTWDAEAIRDFKYKHAMLTASFVQRYVPEVWRRHVEMAAGNHHNPQTRLDVAVSLADYLSAAERNDGTEDQDVRKSHPRQLMSIFATLEADGTRLEERDKSYLPLAPLSLARDVLFPGEAMSNQDDVWLRYNDALWLPFTQEAERLKQTHEASGDPAIYLESLLLLMQRYTWCVPSAYF